MRKTMRKIVFLTQSGRAPTQEFIKKLLKNIYADISDDHVCVLSGPAWNNPKTLIRDMDKDTIICVLEKGDGNEFLCWTVNSKEARRYLKRSSQTSWETLRTHCKENPE